MKKKTLRRLFNFKQINDLTHMVKLNRNVLNFKWENKMNIGITLRLITFAYAALVVFMLIVAFLSTRKHFNNTKYLPIFRDVSSILIIPLLANIFGNDKLTFDQYVCCGILLLFLFVVYLLADWLLTTNSTTNKIYIIYNDKSELTTKNKINKSSIKRNTLDKNNQLNKQTDTYSNTSFNILHVIKILMLSLLFFYIINRQKRFNNDKK